MDVLQHVKFHIKNNEIIFDEPVTMNSGDVIEFVNERFNESGELLVDDVIIVRVNLSENE